MNKKIEESLLDYFVPYGILMERLGIYKKIKIAELYSKNITRRPYASSMPKRLLPYIEQYCKNHLNETIWEFLNKNGFDKQINLHRTQK